MGCGSSTEAQAPVRANAIPLAPTGKPLPPPQPGQNGVWKKPEQDVQHIELTEEVVNEYVELDKEIYRLEKKNVIKKYETKQSYVEEVKKTIDQLEATCKELRKQTEKEKQDVDNLVSPSVAAFLKQEGTYQQKYDEEQQHYLDALQKQEVAEKELHHCQDSHEKASKLAEECKVKADRLNELYDRQDKLLAGIFGGEYGSDLENKLESQLDDALEWLQRVSLAKFKWNNARVLVVHACTQIAFGVKRWKELERIEMNNTRMRYFAAAEARNNFIAAGQNIQSARVYLGKVQFPYCTIEEMRALECCVNAAFTHIQDQRRYQGALGVYQTTHGKASALIQWFDQVIKDTINKDANEAQSEVSSTQKQLRIERLRLMKLQVKETLGKDMDIMYDDMDDYDDDEEEPDTLDADQVNDHENLPGRNLDAVMAMSQPDMNPTPIPEGDLAAAPSSEELFGNIESLRQQHSKERQELEKQQALARAKMDQGLQAKLNARRNHKERMRGLSMDQGDGGC